VNPAPLPVSVLLLARDETADLEALVPRLDFAREVVVVWDEAGDPRTRAAAERLGARVFPRRLDGFGAQRQFALAQCREPWVLWIDADERPAAATADALGRAIAASGGGPGVLPALRTSYFLGRRIRHCGWGGEWIPRFFTRAGARFDAATLHERVSCDGARVLPRDPAFTIEHHSYPDWDTCVAKLVRYAHANAVKAARVGRTASPLDVFLRPPLRFFRQYVLQLGFLDGAHGFLLCSLAAWQVGLKYAELAAHPRGADGPPGGPRSGAR
jgi:(heptosyl)LPS beta-1,4-glucosyltransferase